MGRTPDHYIGRHGETIRIGGKAFSVTTHWASVNGRAACVGVDVHAFRSKNSAKADLSDAKPTEDGWAEITSPVLRGLRVAEVQDQGRRDLMGLLSQALADAPRREARAGGRVKKALEAQPLRRRPGPPALVTDDVLREVVAPAHRTGGRKPVQAVQAALSAHRGGERVSIDQARKAVAKARKRKFLPPVERGSE